MSSPGRTMQKLLNSLRMPRLGAEDDHPLANPREAATIFAELRAADSLKALEEISDWLLSVVSTESLKPERRFEVIRTLDESAQPSRRVNYLYDASGWLQNVSGIWSESIGMDSEGNVQQLP